MPLLDLDRDLYVRRDRSYIDSRERNKNSKSSFDIVVDLERLYQNVESIEATDYSIPTDMATTFYTKTSTSPGNNLLDIRVQNVANTQSLEFSVEFPTNIRYTLSAADRTAFENNMEALVDAAMDAEGHAFFNTGAGANFQANISSVYNYGNVVYFFNGTLVAPAVGTTYTYFLFGSGPNRGNSLERILGFDELIDTKILNWTGTGIWPGYPNASFPQGAFTLYPYGYYMYNPIPYMYVDVFIEEMEPSLLTNVPVARVVFESDYDDTRSEVVPSRPRLMTSPLKRTKRLRIYLRLEDNRRPNTDSTDGWCLSLDVLSLSTETTIPDWVKQRLSYM